MSGCEDTERRKSVLSHTHHLQARQVSQIYHTHIHNLKCVRKWHRSGWPDPHTYTSRHLSLISPVPAAPYRNRISQKLPASRPCSPEHVPSPVCPKLLLLSLKIIYFSKNHFNRLVWFLRKDGNQTHQNLSTMKRVFSPSNPQHLHCQLISHSF